MKRCFLKRFILVSSLISFHFGFSSVPIYGQEDINHLVNHYRNIANHYLIKDKQIWNYIAIDQEGIFIYSSLSKKEQNQPEFSLLWEEVSHFKNLIKYTDRDFQFYAYQYKGNNPFNRHNFTSYKYT